MLTPSGVESKLLGELLLSFQLPYPAYELALSNAVNPLGLIIPVTSSI